MGPMGFINLKGSAVAPIIHAPGLQTAFQADADWARRPSGYTWPEVAGVACDADDRAYVFNRGEHPVMVFARDGSFLCSWGEGIFARPHGISIGPDGGIWCTDDLDHTVRKFTPEGELLLTLGRSGHPSDTGATSIDFRTICHAGPPFHFPTNVAFSPAGEVYVTDGYGNARVHKFTPEGRLLLSWGEPGSGPGQFRVPHGIAVDREGTVYVADRENSRIQLFSPDGEFQGELTDLARPCQVAFDAQGRLLVAELGYGAGMWPGTFPPHPDATGGRVSVFDRSPHAPREGQRSPHAPREEYSFNPEPTVTALPASGNSLTCTLAARWGGGSNPTAAGDFFAPHGIAIDSRGDIYVAEVVFSAGANRGLVSPDCHALQKFVRV